MSLNTPSSRETGRKNHQSKRVNDPIYEILSHAQEKTIITTQEDHFSKAVQSKKIKQLQGLPENLKARQNSNELYKILQIACSDTNYFFEKNTATISDKELIDAVVIIPSMLPESFIKQFHIDHIDADAQNIKEIFKEAKPLWYMDQAKGKYTNRVLFHQGKIMIFRTIKTAIDYQDPKTIGEKRKHDTNKYLNSYGNIYDALRSQEYIIEGQSNAANELKDLQKIIIELIQDIKLDIKSGELKRKLDTILDEIHHAKSHHIVAANINNLSNIVGQHSERERNHLLGAKNKFSKRIADLKKYVATIDIQTNEMKNILHQLEYTIEMLHAQVLASLGPNGPRSKEILYAFENYFNQMAKVPQIPDPFAQFFKTFKTLSNIKESSLEKIILIVTLQRLSLDILKREHAIKTGQKDYQDLDIPQLLSSVENIFSQYSRQEGYQELETYIQSWADEAQSLQNDPEKKKEDIRYPLGILSGISNYIQNTR
jgi:hypothetical protein